MFFLFGLHCLNDDLSLKYWRLVVLSKIIKFLMYTA